MDSVEDLEILRRKIMKKTNICYCIMLLVDIILLVLFKFFAIFMIIFLLIITTIIISIINKEDIEVLNKKYKEKVIKTTIKSVFKDVSFNYSRGISEKKLKSINMIYTGNIFESNDYVNGKYKDINFELSDVSILEEYEDDDGETQCDTLFSGQWYIFDFNKKFKSDVQVCSKMIGCSNESYFYKNNEINYIELEDIEFNKEYNVYAINDIDAFYILTPNNIERIKKLNNEINGDLILSFVDNKLHIGVNNNDDFFELNIVKKINIDDEINKTKNELKTIVDFIDGLELDNDLFKK